ncbi:MAG: hypothetical protein R3Y28_03325 [Candidatus Gastranaerophilales bacterium]
MAQKFLFTSSVTELYKETSHSVNTIKLTDNKHVVKKTLVEMMRQSFFQGPSRFGTNFIA